MFLTLLIIGPFEGRTIVRMEGEYNLRQISLSVPDEFFLADPKQPIEIFSNKKERIHPDSTMLIYNR